jgi:hypothetical protein
MPDNQYQELFDRQKRTFASGVTRTYNWRVDQLDRMAKMITENEGQLQTAIREDFKSEGGSGKSFRWRSSSETRVHPGRRSKCRVQPSE